MQPLLGAGQDIVKGEPPTGFQHPAEFTVEADLIQTADGRTELSTLTASGRITYEDEENEFAGSELFYDHKTSVMKVEGDESQPCYFNGALVEEIELNSRTRKVEAKVVAPGALQINR